MKRIIDKVNEINEKTLTEYEKKVKNVIDYLKSIDIPKKPKQKEEDVLNDVPEIIDIHEEKVYTENEKMWNEVFESLSKTNEVDKNE